MSTGVDIKYVSMKVGCPDCLESSGYSQWSPLCVCVG